MNENESIGWSSRLGAHLMNSPLRRFVDRFLAGNALGTLLDELGRLYPGEGAVLLEQGAGSGYFTIPVAESIAPAMIHCVDISPAMLGVLRDKATRRELSYCIETVTGPAEMSGLGNGSVDGVYSGFLFHELPDPGAAIDEAKRVLVPGGHLVILDFAGSGGPGRPSGKSRHHRHDAHGKFAPHELGSLVESRGFTDVAVRQQGRILIARARHP